MRNLTGTFETHITSARTDRIDDLRLWAKSRSLKFTHIVLARGATCSQPMLTFHGEGTLENAISKAINVANMMSDSGFLASRFKIEVDIENPGVPVTDDDACELTAGEYFEFHVKLEIPDDLCMDSLTQIALQHNAHLSKNAIRIRNDGKHERFLTQRCHGVGSQTAIERHECLLMVLRSSGYQVLELEKELVVFDSNVDVDAGWLHD